MSDEDLLSLVGAVIPRGWRAELLAGSLLVSDGNVLALWETGEFSHSLGPDDARAAALAIVEAVKSFGRFNRPLIRLRHSLD